MAQWDKISSGTTVVQFQDIFLGLNLDRVLILPERKSSVTSQVYFSNTV